MAAVLITAAVSKILFPSSGMSAAITSHEIELTYVIVASEIALACGILLCESSNQARFIGLITFSAFLTWNTFKYLSNETHCNCFGGLPLKIIVSMALDALMIAILALGIFTRRRAVSQTHSAEVSR